MLASLKQNSNSLALKEGSLVQAIIERTYSFLFLYVSMVRKKVVIEFIAPIEELIVLMVYRQVLPNQGTNEPLATPSIIVKQFHRLLL